MSGRRPPHPLFFRRKKNFSYFIFIRVSWEEPVTAKIPGTEFTILSSPPPGKQKWSLFLLQYYSYNIIINVREDHCKSLRGGGTGASPSFLLNDVLFKLSELFSTKCILLTASWRIITTESLCTYCNYCTLRNVFHFCISFLSWRLKGKMNSIGRMRLIDQFDNIF